MNETDKASQTPPHLNTLERRVLAFMVTHPDEAFKAVEDIGIVREDFTSDERHASAFSAMLLRGPDNRKELTAALLNAMGDAMKGQKGQKTIEDFMDLACEIHKLRSYFVEFKQAIVSQKYLREMFAVQSDPSICQTDIPDVLERLNNEMRTELDALERFRGVVVDQTGEFDGTVPTPEELMDMPGFVNALAAYTFATAPRPNRVLAFAGALAMLSHLVGRKYTDLRGTRPNLYLVALADSGVGKDHPRKVNKALADKVEALDDVAEQIASGQGLEDALFEHPNMLFQMDEFDTLLNALKDSSSISEGFYTYLLSIFSESGSPHAMRKKATSQEAKVAMAANPTAAAKRATLKIYNPSLTLFATAIPNRFYSALTLRALDNGLLARCLILEAGLRGAAGEGPFDTPLPDGPVQFAQITVGRDRQLQWGAPVTPYSVPDAEGVSETAKRIRGEADALYDKAAKQNDAAGKAVWNRGYEITAKLALLYALSENLASPRITTRGFEWAWRLVQYSSKRMLAMADAYIATDREEADCNTIVNYLATSPGCKGERGTISHKKHISSKRMDAAEDTLVDRGQITVTKVGRTTIYRLTAKRKER